MRSFIKFMVFSACLALIPTALNSNFAVWQRPTSILVARFAKIGVQFDF